MKSLLFSLLALLCGGAAVAQNVAINNDGSAPDPKAQLDVKATNKGVLLPRISDVSQITGNVPLGLLVFVTDGDRGFYYNASSLPGSPNWKKVTTGSDLFWQYSSPNYLTTNGSYNVGIGTPTPLMPLHVSRTSDTALLLLENQITLATNVNTGLYFKTGPRYTGAIKTIGTSNVDARLGFFTYSTFSQNGFKEAMSILDNGNIGIGTTTPSGKLSVRANNAGATVEGFQDGTGPAAYFQSTSGTGMYVYNTSTTQPAINAQSSGTAIVATGRVGIGNSTPTQAGLVVDGKVGAVNAMFGSNTTGVAIESSWPGLGLNTYFNGTRKFIGTGYGSLISLNQQNGNLSFYVSSASGAADAAPAMNEAITVEPSGYVGIGTNNPSSQLSVASNASSTAVDVNQNGSGMGGSFYSAANVGLYSWTSSTSQPALYAQGNGYALVANGRVGIDVSTPSEKLEIFKGRIRFKGNLSNSNAHGVMFTNNAGTADRGFLGMLDDNTMGFYGSGAGWDFLYDVNDGSVRIGTAQKASGYMLNVGGKAIAEEVRVQLRASWPDYVFKRNYSLMPLSQLESFINQNNHLPNIPKAEVIEKEGTDLGEMQRKMMEKIEELTLYVIEQNKTIEKLTKRLTELETKKQ